MKLMNMLWLVYHCIQGEASPLQCLGRQARDIPDRLPLQLLSSIISLLKHMNWTSHGWDLGIFDQYLWQLSNFHIAYNTVSLVSNLLGDHFNPILFLMVPLLWIWRWAFRTRAWTSP